MTRISIKGRGTGLALVAVVVCVIGFALTVGRRERSEPVSAATPVPTPAAFGAIEELAGPIRERIEQVDPTTLRIGRVTVDAADRQILLPAVVILNEGLIEVVLSTWYGKVHESVFSTPVRPLDLHVACLLIGLREGPNPGWRLPEEVEYRPPGWDKPPGSLVNVFVGWEAGSEPREMPIEACLMDQPTSRSLPSTAWVFTGSWLDPDGVYAADALGSIITNYHDPSAVIDCPLELGQADDYTFANPSRLPDVGTTVTIRIVPAK